MADEFDDPGTAAAIDLTELNGRLLLVKPHRVEVGVHTVLGPRDATVVDVCVIDGPDPREIREAFFWPKVLQLQVHSLVGTGRYVLGRLGQGVAKPGQNAPWKLADATDDDKAAARRYLNGRNIAAPDNTAANDDPAPDTTGADDDKPPW